MDYLPLVRFAVGVAFLLVASVMDVRTRRVPNILWQVMGSAAMAILAVDLYLRGASWVYYLIFVPIVILFMEAFVEREPLFSEGKIHLTTLVWFLIPLLAFLTQIYMLGRDTLFVTLATIPLMMVFIYILYMMWIIYGGADAKALLAIVILVPFYPVIPAVNHMASLEFLGLVQMIYPFLLVMMLNAAMMSMFFTIFSSLTINIKNGDVGFPQMFIGHKRDVDSILDSFVWPLEYYEEGKHVFKLRPKGIDEEKAVESLKENGRKKAWVMLKVPFLVFIFLGYVLSFIIGNPIFHIFMYFFS